MAWFQWFQDPYNLLSIIKILRNNIFQLIYGVFLIKIMYCSLLLIYISDSPYFTWKNEALIFDLSDFISCHRYLLPLKKRLKSTIFASVLIWWFYSLSGTWITMPDSKSDASMSFALQISYTARLVSVSSDLYVLAISHNVSP